MSGCGGGGKAEKKKPDNLEPKQAGLSGSPKWGLQRKAVALIKTAFPEQSSFDTAKI
jgi:hypothetical protein